MPFTKDFTITVNPATCVVTFVDWNGKELGRQEVKFGTAATALTDPERIGFQFAGWRTEDGIEWDFESLVISDIVLYAQWESPNISIDERLAINLESWPDDDGVFSPRFCLTAKESIDATLFVASYDAQGVLIQTNNQGISLEAGDMASVQASISKVEGLEYKFFIWDGEFIPLTELTSF